MASTASFTSSAQIEPNETETPYSTPVFRPSSRRTSSFSSSPSFSSNSSSGSFCFQDAYESPFSPRSPLRFSGIPFSWEQLPGIPKNGIPKEKESSQELLPLPPAGNSNSFRKHTREDISPKEYNSESFRKDPFFAALVECSKDNHEGIHDLWKSTKATKTLSDRFGLIMNLYTSCKRTCAVSESIVYLPRSRADNLLNRRSS